MFDGAYNNSSGYAKLVGGTAASYQNYRFCTSGANSGIHCGIAVNNPNTTVNYGYGYIAPLVRGKASSGVASVGGDSGGPVIGPYNGAYVKMSAVGIISGGTDTTSCPATAVYPGTLPGTSTKQCFQSVY